MKNSKTFLITYSLSTLLLGLILLFLPDFLLINSKEASGLIPSYLLQLTGGLYLGFAMLSWMSRGQPLGGIYGRPLMMANFVYLLTGVITILKAPGLLVQAGLIGWYIGIYYLVFSICYGILLFRSPV